MQLFICVLFVWFVIIVFTLIPKRLSPLDFICLYCVTVLFTTTVFTLFDLDFRTVTIPRTPIPAFATIITRIVTIPLFIMIAVDALQTSSRYKVRWFLAGGTWLFCVVFDWFLYALKVIIYHKTFLWHAISTCITYLVFILIGWVCTKLFKMFGEKTVRAE